MTYTVVYDPPPPHHCNIPAAFGFNLGAIIQCDQCGQQWKLDEYDRWYKMAQRPPVAVPKYEPPRHWWHL